MKDSPQSPFSQVSGKAGVGLAIVLIDGRIGVDGAIIALAQDKLCMHDVQIAMEIGPARPLHAVVRPQNLSAISQLDALIWLSAGMRGGKRLVPGGMPVLCEDDVLEMCGEPIDEGDKLIAARNGKASARTEIVLNVNDQQNISGPNGGILHRDVSLIGTPAHRSRCRCELANHA